VIPTATPHPYSDLYSADPHSSTFIRTFAADAKLAELVWHRDRRTRQVTVLEGRGWHLQFDDALPVPLVVGRTYTVPRMLFHRVLREADCSVLVVQIEEVG